MNPTAIELPAVPEFWVYYYSRQQYTRNGDLAVYHMNLSRALLARIGAQGARRKIARFARYCRHHDRIAVRQVRDIVTKQLRSERELARRSA